MVQLFMGNHSDGQERRMECSLLATYIELELCVKIAIGVICVCYYDL